MDAPSVPPGVPLATGEGVPVGPTLDTPTLYSVLDSLLRGLGQSVEMFRENYDGILSDFKAHILGDFEATESIAASDLAAEPAAFKAWSRSVGVTKKDVIDSGVRSEVDRIKNSIRYPKGLLEIDKRVDARERNVQGFADAVKNWTTTDQTIRWDETSQVPNLWEHLLFSWSLSKSAVQKNHNGATQRPLVHAMVQLVFFQYPTDVGYEILLEMPVALPRPSRSPTTGAKFAKADTIVLREVPESLWSDIEYALIEARVENTGVHCLYRPLSDLYIGVFATESRRSSVASVEYRIAMDLCSMQYQRRILGLEDKFVYGATYSGGTFALFASRWLGEQLLWMRVNSCVWNLGDPPQFIQCLYFLWELKKHLDKSFEDDYNTLNADTVVDNVKNQKPSWRFRDETDLKDLRIETGEQIDQEDSAAGDIDITDYADSGNRPLTLQDIVINLPFIYDELMKLIRIEEWKGSIVRSEHESALDHADEEGVMGE